MTPAHTPAQTPPSSPSARFARIALTAIVLALSVLGGVVWWTVQRNRRPGAPQYKTAPANKPVSHAPFSAGTRDPLRTPLPDTLRG